MSVGGLLVLQPWKNAKPTNIPPHNNAFRRRAVLWNTASIRFIMILRLESSRTALLLDYITLSSAHKTKFLKSESQEDGVTLLFKNYRDRRSAGCP
jgi:hypothetical protein